MICPIFFLILIRLWSVSHVRGYVTPADFVRARWDSPTLALLIAITGIVATMPYIALQLIGIEAVLKTMGVKGEIPIVVAFIILALYTYSSGLRAPALIAFVKDTLIYLTIIVAVIVIPSKLGGWDVIFGAAEEKFGSGAWVLLPATGQLQYATLALGSALALFLYPHSITAVLAPKNRDVIKRNMSALPAYSLALALLGFMAIAAGTTPVDGDNNTIVPALMDQMFPDWFAGVAFAAIGIGALVPAAIMSIAAANLFTRNIYKEYFRKDASSRDEARVAKIASLVVKLGALAVIIFIDPQFSIDLQLIGGVIILQTMPALAIGLFTRWFHPWALIAGWVGGMGVGMLMLYNIARIDPATGEVIRAHFGGSAFALSKLGFDTPTTIYTGFVAIGVNLLVTVIATFILRAMNQPEGTDSTRLEDYFADEDDPRVQDLQLDVGEAKPAGEASGAGRSGSSPAPR